MTIKRDVELIEDGRRYRQALLDIAKLVDGPQTYTSSQIMAIVSEVKAAFWEHAPRSGPWPILTDHIARCEEGCKPSGYMRSEERYVSIFLCDDGLALLLQLKSHIEASREKADKEALK